MANYPVPYQNNWGFTGAVGQQMYPQYQQNAVQLPQTQTQTNQQSMYGLKWVDGEVGAKAWQMPQGWPANQPIALWDTNDTVIYLKSTNPMGMPNPLQKAKYVLEDATEKHEETHDMSGYVRKEDMEQMKHELMEAINSISQAPQTSSKHVAKGE